MELILEIGIFAALLLVGWIAGTTTEFRHLRSLERRAAEHRDFLVTDLKSYPLADPERSGGELITAEVVVAADYLKSFLAGLRNLFGGEVRSYQVLLIRARREALLRLIETARARGFNALANVRIDPADVGGNTQQSRLPMAAILACATAYHARPGDS